VSISISAPFRLTGGSVLDTDDLTERVQQKIINVLVTGNYERSGLAEYGAGLQQLVFANVGDLELADWKINASSAISQYVSGVQIIDIRVESTEDTLATITVYYRTPLTSGESLTFNIPLSDVLTEESPL
jgi:phage baseplate assembly protein W